MIAERIVWTDPIANPATVAAQHEAKAEEPGVEGVSWEELRIEKGELRIEKGEFERSRLESAKADFVSVAAKLV